MPGVAILLTVMSLNLFGDWLRDTLDPRSANGITGVNKAMNLKSPPPAGGELSVYMANEGGSREEVVLEVENLRTYFQTRWGT